MCGHCFLIVFDLGDEIFEVSLAIDWQLQFRVNGLDILIFEHNVISMQLCEDIQATHCRLSHMAVLKYPKIYLGHYGFDHPFYCPIHIVVFSPDSYFLLISSEKPQNNYCSWLRVRHCYCWAHVGRFYKMECAEESGCRWGRCQNYTSQVYVPQIAVHQRSIRVDVTAQDV